MKKFIHWFTRRKQMQVAIVIVIIGTISYLLDRRNGAIIVAEDASKIWQYIEITALTLLFFILPIIGLIRESIIINEIYKKKIGSEQNLDLKKISTLLGINLDVLAHDKYTVPLTKEQIKKIIKKYFIM